jgi:hypothetical protein
MATLELTETVSLTKLQIKFLIECTIPDPTKRALECIHFGTNGYAYSTDGHRLAAVSINRLDQSFNIHKSDLKALLKGIGKDRIIGANTCPDPEIIGSYPDVAFLIPDRFASEIEFCLTHRNQVNTALNDPDCSNLSSVAIDIGVEGIKSTEGTGSRWLTAIASSWIANCRSMKVNGDLPELMCLTPEYMDILRRFEWDVIKSNGHLQQVIFQNHITKDFYLIMPRQLQNYEIVRSLLDQAKY